ncbi:DUF6252 family protein [Hymenobacter sp. IS2118]|uniref:DUF6252 family protein n=1 Tax=Hymenobacter sp. IS2118 TaxID=1505605 RepID=UPI000689FE8E|nr:DUF6252 family protein [Hymenobacter sp. IS2118]
MNSLQKQVRHSALLLAALLGLSQCKKKDPSPEAQLPPATQTGANTIGCLVNGKAWTPQGNNGSSNYTVSYDPNFRLGTLNIAAYRYANSQAKQEALGVFSDSLLPSTGIYRLQTLGHHGAGYVNGPSNCTYYSTDATTHCRGELVITRLDRVNGIISGTFAFTLAKPGCDTVRVTNGRFDKRL